MRRRQEPRAGAVDVGADPPDGTQHACLLRAERGFASGTGGTHGSLSRLRHKYQHATDRYGFHFSPRVRIRSAVGRFRSRYCR